MLLLSVFIIINIIITFIITITNSSIYQHYYYYVEPRPTASHRYRRDADEANKYPGGVETDRESEYSTSRVCQVRGWNYDADDDVVVVVVEHY